MRHFFRSIDPANEHFFFTLQYCLTTLACALFHWLSPQPMTFYLILAPLATNIAAFLSINIVEKIKFMIITCTLLIVTVWILCFLHSSIILVGIAITMIAFISLLTTSINPAYRVMICISLLLATPILFVPSAAPLLTAKQISTNIIIGLGISILLQLPFYRVGNLAIKAVIITDLTEQLSIWKMFRKKFYSITSISRAYLQETQIRQKAATLIDKKRASLENKSLIVNIYLSERNVLIYRKIRQTALFLTMHANYLEPLENNIPSTNALLDKITKGWGSMITSIKSNRPPHAINLEELATPWAAEARNHPDCQHKNIELIINGIINICQHFDTVINNVREDHGKQ